MVDSTMVFILPELHGNSERDVTLRKSFHLTKPKQQQVIQQWSGI